MLHKPGSGRKVGVHDMKQISTGAGLVALSVGMVAATWIATHQMGGIALARADSARSPATMLRDDCQVRTESWFDPTPHVLNGCSNFGMGTLKCFTTQPIDHLGNGMTRPTTFGRTFDATNTTVEVLDIQTTDGTTSVSLIRVFEIPGPTTGFDMEGGGWVDMDHDGDMDLLTRASDPLGGWQWYENIAGSGSSANPYDLDHDGNVNTGDLSLLLLNFD